MKRLVIDTNFKAAFDAAGLTSFDAVATRFSEPGPPPAKETVTVKLRALQSRSDEPLQLYFKVYDFPVPAWRYVGRRSKARCEYDNYAVFRQLDIPCADRVAWGEDRDALGRLRRAFIITVAIPDAAPLPQFCQERQPKPATRQEIVRQLSSIAQRLHRAGFCHHDLVVRNLLITPEPKVWLIDCPRGAHRRVGRNRARLKDLASLDKGATLLARRTERLAFLKAYLDILRLDAAAKQLIRDELEYRKERWPDDWR